MSSCFPAVYELFCGLASHHDSNIRTNRTLSYILTKPHSTCNVDIIIKPLTLTYVLKWSRWRIISREAESLTYRRVSAASFRCLVIGKFLIVLDAMEIPLRFVIVTYCAAYHKLFPVRTVVFVTLCP